jgi:hypothetical protein
MEVLMVACWVFFTLTMIINLILSTQAAGPIEKRKLKSEIREEAGE